MSADRTTSPPMASADGVRSATSEPSATIDVRRGDERHDRRLVGVAPRQVLARLEEVELVAVVAVPARHRQEEGGHPRGTEDGTPRRPRELVGTESRPLAGHRGDRSPAFREPNRCVGSAAMGMERAGVTFASLMSFGPAAAVETAQLAERLGYRSYWTAETTGPEAFSILAAAGAAAPSLDLGTGVLALQLRTPMVVAMAGATLQALHPDNDILLGVGISSPVVTSRWHGVPYGDRPARPHPRVRHARARVPHRREGRLRGRLLPGEGLPPRSAPRRAEAEDRHRRPQPEDARAGRRGGRRRRAQLPAGVARALVGRAGAQGRQRRDLRLRARGRVRARRGHRARPARPLLLRGRRLLRQQLRAGRATATRSPRSAPGTRRATAPARWPRCRTAWSTAST